MIPQQKVYQICLWGGEGRVLFGTFHQKLSSRLIYSVFFFIELKVFVNLTYLYLSEICLVMNWQMVSKLLNLTLFLTLYIHIYIVLCWLLINLINFHIKADIAISRNLHICYRKATGVVLLWWSFTAAAYSEFWAYFFNWN